MADCSNTPTPESTANFDLDSRCFSEAMTSNADYTTARASDGNVKKTFAAALREAGWEHVGEWSTNPLVTESNQVIPYAGTNQLFRPLSIPYQVDSATNPDPNALVGTELVDVSQFLSRNEALQMSQLYTADNTSDMVQSTTSGGDVITPEVGQFWSVLGVNYRRVSDLNSLSSFRIETREVEYSNLIEALSEQAQLQVGNFVSIAGHNSSGDGGAARFEVVLSTEEIGIPNNAGTIKLKRIEGQEQWKAQYAGSLPKFIAHRGAAGYTEKNLYFVPENTIYSARRSAEAGFWGLESDAKVTADGQIAVFHDLTVDRTITGQTGLVSSFTMSQLKSFDAGSYVSNIYTNARVMDYNEWFASCRKFSLVPCAEISVAMTDAQVDKFIADCLQYYPDGVGVFLQSTNLETLQKIRAKNANITLYRSFSYGSVPDVALFDDMYALGNAGVHFSGGALNNDPSIVQAAKDRGLCTSYAIANTAELVQTARDLGIHRIMTDFILGDY